MYHRFPAAPRQADPPSVRSDRWDKLPRALRDDPRLTDGDVRLAAVLIGYCRDSASAWPSNGRLAADLRVTPRTVRNRLRRLEAAGWFACRPDGGNRTGRLIVALWREGEGKPVSSPPRKPVSPEGDRVVKERKDPERTTRPEPAPTPLSSPEPLECPQSAPEAPEAQSIDPTPESRPESVLGPLNGTPAIPAPRMVPTGGKRPRPTLTLDDLRRLAPSDPILAAELARRTAPRPEPPPPPSTTPELIERLRECPTYPPRLAHALTVEFHDQGSFAGFHAVAQRAYRGEIELDDLADAYRQASGPQARRPGAVFNHAIRRLTTPPTG